VKSSTWQAIYSNLEARCYRLIVEHDAERKAAGKPAGAIMVADHPLAREYRRLDRLRQHVGLHFCAQNDRERHMKGARCWRVREAEAIKKLEEKQNEG